MCWLLCPENLTLSEVQGMVTSLFNAWWNPLRVWIGLICESKFENKKDYTKNFQIYYHVRQRQLYRSFWCWDTVKVKNVPKGSTDWILSPAAIQEKGSEVHGCKLSWKELQKPQDKNGCDGLAGFLGISYLPLSALTLVWATDYGVQMCPRVWSCIVCVHIAQKYSSMQCPAVALGCEGNGYGTRACYWAFSHIFANVYFLLKVICHQDLNNKLKLEHVLCAFPSLLLGFLCYR